MELYTPLPGTELVTSGSLLVESDGLLRVADLSQTVCAFIAPDVFAFESKGRHYENYGPLTENFYCGFSSTGTLLADNLILIILRFKALRVPK